MPADMIRLGPFLGGLNTFSDATAVQDSEVVELINLELDIDGSLRNRPPITAVTATMPGSTGIDVLGWFQGNAGVKYLIATNRVNATYYFTGTGWIKIADFAAAAMAQARDKAWLVAAPATTDVGGSWSPTSGFVADANMPRGGCAVAHKDRVWIGAGKKALTNGARLYLSSITSGTVTWPSTPIFIQIGAGDGENVVDLAVYYDSLVIFKEGSTYSFTFSTDPSLGEVRRQSQNIGALDKGCVTAYQNQLYVVFDNKVYEFANYNFTEISNKVPLKATNPSAAVLEKSSISYWADRLFVSFYDVTYVYSFRTRTWSTWQSDLVEFFGRIWLVPGEQDDKPRAYTYSTTAGPAKIYQIIDAIGTESELMKCIVTTKNYDYQNPSNFKALKTWGIDCISKVRIEASANPIVYANTLVTWDMLKEGDPPRYIGPGGTAYDFRMYTNLVLNGSFEDADISFWAPVNSGSTLSRDNVVVATGKIGSYVLKSTATGTTSAVGTTTIGRPATAGKWYLFRNWWGVPSAEVSPTRMPLTQLVFRDAANAVLTNPSVSNSSAAGALPAGLITSVVAQAPTGTTNLTARSYYSDTAGNLPAGVAYYVDQAIVQEFATQADALAAQADWDARGYYDKYNPVIPGALTASRVDGSVEQWIPYTELQGYTWDYLNTNRATWDRLLEPFVQVESDVDTLGSGPGRKFVKFPQALRFRQIGFRITAETYGDVVSAPFQLFSIMTKVADKQYMSRRIS